MTRTRIVAFALCVALLSSLAGCFASDNPDATSPTVLPPGFTASSLYLQASDKVNTAESLILYIGTLKETTVGSQTFSESSQQYLNLQNCNTGSFQASMSETLHVGTYDITVSEAFADGTGYFTVNGSNFTTQMTSEEFRARYTPTTLFNPSVYSEVCAVAYGKGICIQFNQPTAAESWALPQGAVFTDASGFAILDENGNLTESNYTVRYTIDGISVSKTTRTVIGSTPATVNVPSSTEGYTPLDCPYAPRNLELACGYLLQAQKIGSTLTENIVCQAFSINRTETAVLSMSGLDQTLQASLDRIIKQVNESFGGASTNRTLKELFQNGTYTISEDGSQTTTDESIDSTFMRKYCQDLLVSTIILPAYISSAAISETDTSYTITFIATDPTLAEAICADICYTIYGNATMLDEMASESTPDAVQYTLEVDKRTGMPIKSGIEYGSTHVIWGISYRLTSTTEQIYQFA